MGFTPNAVWNVDSNGVPRIQVTSGVCLNTGAGTKQHKLITDLIFCSFAVNKINSRFYIIFLGGK